MNITAVTKKISQKFNFTGKCLFLQQYINQALPDMAKYIVFFLINYIPTTFDHTRHTIHIYIYSENYVQSNYTNCKYTMTTSTIGLNALTTVLYCISQVVIVPYKALVKVTEKQIVKLTH